MTRSIEQVLGYTELSLDVVEKETKLEDNLQEIYVAGNRAKDLVKQILAFARRSEEKQNPIQPSIIVKEVLKFIRFTLPSSIEIRQYIESSSLIMGNATQIHQVLMNLCTNAAHAMEEKGGILEVSLKDVQTDKDDLTTGVEPGPYIEIKVSDTGIGIPQEIIKSIFDRILFVEDEFPIAKMGGQILERLGYSVTTRTSSIEALELFQNKPNDFDLVITDMTMPNLTGDKLAV